jgi:hypothetical protein
MTFEEEKDTRSTQHILDARESSKGQAWLNRSANNLDTLKASSDRMKISVREAEGGVLGFKNGNGSTM